MSIYIVEEFEPSTLESLLAEVGNLARAAWYANIESDVWYTYQITAREEVRIGRSSPGAHPGISAAWFSLPALDLCDTETVGTWERALARELTGHSALFGPEIKDEDSER